MRNVLRKDMHQLTLKRLALNGISLAKGFFQGLSAPEGLFLFFLLVLAGYEIYVLGYLLMKALL